MASFVSDRSIVSYINEPACEAGRSYIFVNGISNTVDQAESSASQIASRLGNKRVVLFYNPTGLEDTSAEKTRFLIRRLFDLVHSEFRRCRESALNPDSVKMRVFTHSHGSVLIKNVMEDLENEPRIKSSIEIISLGGGVLIPDRLAGKVSNFINEFDLVPVLANNPMPENFRYTLFRTEISNIIRPIFSETLLYEQTPDQQRAGQLIKAEFMSRHQGGHIIRKAQEECNGEQPRNPSEALELAFRMVSRDPESCVEFGLNTMQALLCSSGYSIKIMDSPNSHSNNPEMLKYFLNAIRDPYTGEGIEAFVNLGIGCLFPESKIDFFKDHSFESYLQNIQPETL